MVLLIFLIFKSPVGVVGVIGSTWGIPPGPFTVDVAQKMAEAGAGWVRVWVSWYQVEHDSGSFDWEALDSTINLFKDRGFEIFVTLQGGNPYYDTLDIYPEDIPFPYYGLPPVYFQSAMQRWLEFVQEAVQRYRDRVKYWSIWNEPNLRDYWPPEPDPPGYLNLAIRTSQTIKSADPEAKIIAGNTSLIDYDFLFQILDSLIPYIDFVGFHPYRIYPEDDQDNFPVASLIVDPTPMTSFDEEMDSLLNLIRSFDPEGRVSLWDEESGYPSRPDPYLWENGHYCDTVQAKCLLRKYLLDFSYFVEVSTYWGDFDLNSLYFNALGEHWVDDFNDMTLDDWKEKEYPLLFNTIAITNAGFWQTLKKGALDYDTLSGNLFPGSSYIFYPETLSDGFDSLTFARYTFTITEEGLYTPWLRMRNPDTTKIPVWIGTFDGLNYFVVTTKNPNDSLNRFIWNLPFEAESLTGNAWWAKGPKYFQFTPGEVTLSLFPYFAGSQLDSIALRLEKPPVERKLSFYAMKNLASIWDGRFFRDTSLNFSVNPMDVPDSIFTELRAFSFLDTTISRWVILLWFGTPPYDDNFPNYHIDLSIETSDVFEPILFDFLSGDTTTLNYTTTDSTVEFQALPISDSPKLLALDRRSVGIIEKMKLSSIKVEMPTIVRGRLPISVRGAELLSYRIYDVSGRLVTRGFIEGESSTIYLNLPSGFYTLLLEGKEKVKRSFILLR
jgi:hypothetical protein